MAKTDFLAACAALGFRVNKETETATGVVGGVAFRADPTARTLELSVNLPEKRLPKLVSSWQSLCAGLTAVVGEGCRVVLTCPDLETWDAARLQAVLERVTADSVDGMDRSFTDRHEKNTEPFFCYMRGLVGALLGAIVGAMPWFIAWQFTGWNFWSLLGLVSVASFYGYRLLGGAHSTRFALGCVAVFTLLAILLFTFGSLVYDVYELRAFYAEQTGDWKLLNMDLPEVALYCLQNSAMRESVLRSVLIPLVFPAASLFLLRRQILVYTHEGAFLRRGKRRK